MWAIRREASSIFHTSIFIETSWADRQVVSSSQSTFSAPIQWSKINTLILPVRQISMALFFWNEANPQGHQTCPLLCNSNPASWWLPPGCSTAPLEPTNSMFLTMYLLVHVSVVVSCVTLQHRKTWWFHLRSPKYTISHHTRVHNFDSECTTLTLREH